MKVFVTRRLPEKALRILEREVDVEMNPSDRVLSKKELIEGVKDADGLLCLLTDEIDEEVVSSSNLRVISNYAVGYNNIDLKKATERGIPVTNTPEVLTETTADFTFALILSLARRIVEGDRFLRNLKFKGWAPLLLLGTDVFRKTLGIVGLGRIGSGVARRAMGFSMRIIYYQRRRNKRLEEKLGAEYLEFSELLKISDFITLHIPLTKETHHLVSDGEFELMKPSSYLINTSRGPVVNERALIEALQNKKIRGAALDVFEFEPEVSKELLKLENVILTPHIASASFETREKMALMAVENLLMALKGEKPKNTVNPEVFE